MCNSSSERKIDPCMKNIIKALREMNIRTVGSCCGHFLYHLTIIYEDKVNGNRFDLVSGIEIPRRVKSYKKDKNGFYFIPEVEDYWRIND